MEADEYDEMGEDEESDADDFIVDDDGRPITEKKKRARRIFNDANLQEGKTYKVFLSKINHCTEIFVSD